jgi:deazaflavin-dependent oxidoreductase (nitroreductase family)
LATPYAGTGRFHRAIRAFGTTAVGSALLAPIANRLDRLVLRLTKGRRTAFDVLTGIPPVQLTTTGARSGSPRTVNVLGLPHPEGLGLLASNFGRANHPAWFSNLLAHPDATVRVRGEDWPVRARLATPEERATIWSEGLSLAPGWRKYQDRTGGREIQAVVLVRQPLR